MSEGHWTHQPSDKNKPMKPFIASDSQLHLQADPTHYRLDVLRVQQRLSGSGVPERLMQPVWAASCGPCRRSSSSSCSGSSPACHSSSAPRISQPAAASSSRLQDDREEKERLQQSSEGFCVCSSWSWRRRFIIYCWLFILTYLTLSCLINWLPVGSLNFLIVLKNGN